MSAETPTSSSFEAGPTPERTQEARNSVERATKELQNANGGAAALFAIAMLIKALFDMRRGVTTSAAPESRRLEQSVAARTQDNPETARKALEDRNATYRSQSEELRKTQQNLEKQVSALPSDDPARAGLLNQLNLLSTQMLRYTSQSARLLSQGQQLLVEQARRASMVSRLQQTLTKNRTSRAARVGLAGNVLLINFRTPLSEADQKQVQQMLTKSAQSSIVAFSPNGTTVTVPAEFWAETANAPGTEARAALFDWLAGTPDAVTRQRAPAETAPPAPEPAETVPPRGRSQTSIVREAAQGPQRFVMEFAIERAAPEDVAIASDGVEWRKGTDGMWFTDHENFHRTQHGEALVKMRLQAYIPRDEVRRAEADRSLNADRVIARGRGQNGEELTFRRPYPFKWERTSDVPRTITDVAREYLRAQRTIPSAPADTSSGRQTPEEILKPLREEYNRRIIQSPSWPIRDRLRTRPPSTLEDQERKELVARLTEFETMGQRIDQLQKMIVQTQMEAAAKEGGAKQEEADRKEGEARAARYKREAERREHARQQTTKVMEEVRKASENGGRPSDALLLRAERALIDEMQSNPDEARTKLVAQLFQEITLFGIEVWEKRRNELRAQMQKTREAWRASPGEATRKAAEDAAVRFYEFLHDLEANRLVSANERADRTFVDGVNRDRDESGDAILELRRHLIVDPAHQNIAYQSENLVPAGTIRLLREDGSGQVRYTVWRKVGQGAGPNGFSGWECISEPGHALLGHDLVQQRSVAQFRRDLLPNAENPAENTMTRDTLNNRWVFRGGQWLPSSINTRNL